MTNTMTYKGYSARIEYDDDDGIMTGQIAGIRDGVGFHADSVEELKVAFHEAVDDYVETCAKIGKEPQKPYSGRVMFRVDPEVHRNAALAAELAGKSLNQWAEEVLRRAARGGQRQVPAQQADLLRQLPSRTRHKWTLCDPQISLSGERLWNWLGRCFKPGASGPPRSLSGISGPSDQATPRHACPAQFFPRLQ